jgi:hypothetical protein
MSSVANTSELEMGRALFKTRGKLLASEAAIYTMGATSKSTKALIIALAMLALAVAWICFQLGTHHHTGILRALAEAKHLLSNVSTSPDMQARQGNASPGPQHSVNLSWKPSTSPVIGYNVYRRGPSGLVKLNVVPVAGTTYVDSTVQPGQTYYYTTKAVSPTGIESTPSNEVRAPIPLP